MGNLNMAKIHAYNKLEHDIEEGGKIFSGPYVHPDVKDFDKEITDHFQNLSLIENNIEKMKKFKNRPCLGRRKKIGEKDGKNIYDKEYTFFTYGEVNDLCVKFAKNLHENRDEFIKNDTYMNIDFQIVGIFAKNCTEWVITDMGCQMDSVTTATLYSTLGPEAFNYICQQTDIKTIFVSPDLVKTLCEMKTRYKLDNLKYAVLFDLTTNCKAEEELKKLGDCGFIAYSFSKYFLKENNMVKDNELIMSKPDTIMTICYTSGTTGNPKGVMLSQRNLRCVLDTIIKDSEVPLDENGAHASFLPLAHIFERMVISGFMAVAAKIGFISGSIKETLMEDLSILGPTLLFTVPKVLQNIRRSIFDNFNKLGGFKSKLAWRAYYTKLENLKKYGIITHAFYDGLIFNKIRNMFGGKIKVLLCASAPMAKDMADDFKVFLSIPVIEGLGMTELAGSAFCTNFHDLTNYTAGGITTAVRMRIYSLPDLGYTIEDKIDGFKCPAGEICLKGPLVFKGYYKNDEETNKAFDKDGFFHTGDVARIFTQLGNGLKIVDRVKEIFKLSQGEYIIPAKLEVVYSKSQYVSQILIYGNSSKNHIIGIIKPDNSHCARALGVKDEDIDKMEDDEKLKNLIIDDLLKLAIEAEFNGLEKVHYVLLTSEGFTIQNSCMTPTMKLVRKKIEQKFLKEINILYNSMPNDRISKN